MKNILITSFGSNTSIGVAKSLKNQCRIFGTDTNPIFRCNGYEFAVEVFQLPFSYQENYLDQLNLIVEEFKIDCIIPIHDNELLVLAKAYENKLIQCNVAVNSSDIIELCNDKKSINNCLKKFLNVPSVYNSLENVSFPVIIKENDGVSSQNIRILEREEQLLETEIEGKVIQEYIEGGIEYTVDCYTSYVNREAFYYSVRERVATKSGMSTKSDIVFKPELGKLCEKIHNELNYVGVSNIQFIEKDNKFYFIEINPRFAGGGVLTYKSGYNFPESTVHELCVNKEAKLSRLGIGNKMVRYYSETFFDEKNNFIRLG